MAPAAMASRTRPAIWATSSPVALRCCAARPMTHCRTAEWPSRAATLRLGLRRSSASKYAGNVSNSHVMPACIAFKDMPSTFTRVRSVASRSCGRQGAMAKPQLPITVVVTPCQMLLVAYGSHVYWAS